MFKFAVPLCLVAMLAGPLAAGSANDADINPITGAPTEAETGGGKGGVSHPDFTSAEL